MAENSLMAGSFMTVAAAAAQDAGALLRDRLSRPRDIQFKGLVDLVTDADRASEALIANRLRAAFPHHRILGEEGARGAHEDAAGADAPYRWLIDPLDGTTNYAHTLPHFAVSIALEHAGAPLLGVVYDPMRDELFAAERGRGATRNGDPLRVSATDDLIGAVLVTGFAYDLQRRADQALAWRAFLTRVQAIRQTGSAALNLCYVAAGRVDGYWERWIQPWDVGAGTLIVAEAGGRVTDLAGSPTTPDARQILATNALLHPPMLAVLVESAAGSRQSAGRS